MSCHTVVITGATRGLGREMALRFARAGHRVVALYSSDDVAAHSLAGELRGMETGSTVIRHDVTSEDGAVWSSPLVGQAESLVLINNAWTRFTPQPFHLLSWADFEIGLNVGLKGAWLCARGVLRLMVSRGRGTIVNVLTAALDGMPPKGFAAYVAAKHSVRGLTLALAAEYADRGLRVFSVSPGFMLTTLTDSWDPRLVESVRRNAAATDVRIAAQKVVELVASPAVRGRGEDFSLGSS